MEEQSLHQVVHGYLRSVVKIEDLDRESPYCGSRTGDVPCKYWK